MTKTKKKKQLILRIDVDLFSPRWQSKETVFYRWMRNLLNGYGYRNIGYYLGYMKHIPKMLSFLKELNIKGTWFLSYIPYPRKIIELLYHEDLGLHTTSEPIRIVEEDGERIGLNLLFGRSIKKLSVHTIEGHKKYWRSYLDLDGFKVLSGNQVDFHEVHRDVYYNWSFPGCYFTRNPQAQGHEQKMKLEELPDNAVVCTHPSEISGHLTGCEDTPRQLEWMAENCKVLTFEDWLRLNGQ